MNSRDSANLDRYITGNYGEDQFSPITRIHDEVTLSRDASVHAEYIFFQERMMDPVYGYDEADDGPECEVIKAVFATHTMKELRNERILTLLGVGL